MVGRGREAPTPTPESGEVRAFAAHSPLFQDNGFERTGRAKSLKLTMLSRILMRLCRV
jgi:hypothetical protein